MVKKKWEFFRTMESLIYFWVTVQLVEEAITELPPCLKNETLWWETWWLFASHGALSIILTEAHFCFINQQNLVLLLRLWTLAKKHVHPHPREHSPASSSWTYSNTVMVPVICAGLLSFCWIFSFLLCFPISVSYLLFPVLLWSLVLCISMLLLLSPLAHLNCVSFWNQPSKCAYTHTHQPIH